MFDIEYKGANSVIISTKNAKLVTDPKLSLVGLKDLSTDGMVEVATEDRFMVNNPESELIIHSPGEYGVKDFDISGVAARRHLDNKDKGLNCAMYRVEIGDARIGIIGNISPELSDEQLEQLGVLDILILPVGGNGYTLDATSAADVVRVISPKVVVPVHYADPSLKYEVPQDDLEAFIKELGAPVEEAATKYKVKQIPVATDTVSVVKIARS